jgi:hypothetical protein
LSFRFRVGLSGWCMPDRLEIQWGNGTKIFGSLWNLFDIYSRSIQMGFVS